MSTNPYAAPAEHPPHRGTPRVDAKLLAVASSHRGVNLALLAYLVTTALTFAGVPQTMLALVVLVIIIATAILVYRLAAALGGTLIGATCTVLLFVPFLGLLVLVYLSRLGTKRLRGAGFRVGLLGVRPRDLEAALEGRNVTVIDGPR